MKRYGIMMVAAASLLAMTGCNEHPYELWHGHASLEYTGEGILKDNDDTFESEKVEDNAAADDSQVSLPAVPGQPEAVLGEALPEVDAEGNSDLTGIYDTEEKSREMVTQESVYPRDVEVIMVKLVNNTDEAFYVESEQFTLWKMENGVEIPLPYTKDGDYFTELALEVPANGSASRNVNLKHYDLPLEDGVYVVEIDGMKAQFEVHEGASAGETTPIPTVNMVAMQDDTSAETASLVNVLLQNTGNAPLTVRSEDFGLEHFMEGAVSYTPFSGENSREETIPAGGTLKWVLASTDYGMESWEEGDYAVVYRNLEAPFTWKLLTWD